jgi:hypothetical protein
LFSVTTNFLRVNGGKYSIVVCFSKIVITITTSRKLVRMGKRICLFVYYAKLISVELQMDVEGVALKGGLEHWTVEGMIRRGILQQCRSIFLLA